MKIRVRTIPNSKKEVVQKVSSDEFKMKIKQKAIDGKANKRVCEILSEIFGKEERKIKIKNPSSRNKIIEIED